jgi:hypothetical protein
MTGSPSAYDRVRVAIAQGREPVRRLCAREGVSWQGFYRHDRREGWVLRQPKRRRSEPGILESIEAILQACIAEPPRGEGKKDGGEGASN